MSKQAARLELNFAPPRRIAPAGWLLVGVGIAAGTVALVLLRAGQAERATQQAAVSAATAALSAYGPGAAGPAADPRATKAATLVARDLQMPWAEMLSALEAVPARDVSLVAVEPSPLRHSIRITAEAKSTEAMLAYVAALKSEAFPEVTLSAHQREAQTPGNPVRFVVQARWKAA